MFKKIFRIFLVGVFIVGNFTLPNSSNHFFRSSLATLAPAGVFSAKSRAQALLAEVNTYFREGFVNYRKAQSRIQYEPALDRAVCDTTVTDEEIEGIKEPSIKVVLAERLKRNRRDFKSRGTLMHLKQYREAVIAAGQICVNRLIQGEKIVGGVDNLLDATRVLSLMLDCLNSYRHLPKNLWKNPKHHRQLEEESVILHVETEKLATAIGKVYLNLFGNAKQAFLYFCFLKAARGKTPLQDPDPEIDKELIPVLLLLQKTQAALFLVEAQKKIQTREDSSLLLHQIIIQTELQNFTEARRLIAQARQKILSPEEKLKFHHWEGFILSREAEIARYQNADPEKVRQKFLEAYRHFLSPDPKNFQNIYRALHALFASDPWGKENLEQVVKLASPYVQLDSDDTHCDLYTVYAQACWRLGKLDEAFRALRQMIFENAFSPFLYIRLFESFSFMGMPEEAYEAFRRGFELSSQEEHYFPLFFCFSPRLGPIRIQLLTRLLGDPELGPLAEEAWKKQVARIQCDIYEPQARPLLEGVIASDSFGAEARARASRMLQHAETVWKKKAAVEPAPAPSPTPPPKPPQSTPAPQCRWIHEALEMNMPDLLQELERQIIEKGTLPKREAPASSASSSFSTKEKELKKLLQKTSSALYPNGTEPQQKARDYFQILCQTYLNQVAHTFEEYQRIFEYGMRAIEENVVHLLSEIPPRDGEHGSYETLRDQFLLTTDSNLFWYIFAHGSWFYAERLFQRGEAAKAREVAQKTSSCLETLLSQERPDLAEGIINTLVWLSYGALDTWGAQLSENAEEKTQHYRKALAALEKAETLLKKAQNAFTQLREFDQWDPARRQNQQKDRDQLAERMRNTPEVARRQILNVKIETYSGLGLPELAKAAAQELLAMPPSDDEAMFILSLNAYDYLGRLEEAIAATVAYLDRRGDKYQPSLNLMNAFANHLLLSGKEHAAFAVHYYISHILAPGHAESLEAIFEILLAHREHPSSKKVIAYFFDQLLGAAFSEFQVKAMERLLKLISTDRELYLELFKKVLLGPETGVEAFRQALLRLDDDLPQGARELHQYTLVAPDKKDRGSRANQLKAEYNLSFQRLKVWNQTLLERIKAWKKQKADPLFEPMRSSWAYWENLSSEKIRTILTQVWADETVSGKIPLREETDEAEIYFSFQDKIIGAVAAASARAYLEPYLPELNRVFGLDAVEKATRSTLSLIALWNSFSEPIAQKMTYAKIRRVLLAELICQLLMDQYEIAGEEELIHTEDLIELLGTQEGGEPQLENLLQNINALVVDRFKTYFPFYAGELAPDRLLAVLLNPGLSRDAVLAHFAQQQQVDVTYFEPQTFGDFGFHLVIDRKTAAPSVTLYFPTHRPKINPKNLTQLSEKIKKEEIDYRIALREEEILECLRQKGISREKVSIRSNFGDVALLEQSARWKAFFASGGRTLADAVKEETGFSLKSFVTRARHSGHRIRVRLFSNHTSREATPTIHHFRILPVEIPRKTGQFFAVEQNSKEPFLRASWGNGEMILRQLLQLPQEYSWMGLLNYLQGCGASRIFLSPTGKSGFLFYLNRNGLYEIDLTAIISKKSRVAIAMAKNDPTAKLQEATAKGFAIIQSLQDVSFLLASRAEADEKKESPRAMAAAVHLWHSFRFQFNHRIEEAL